LALVDQLAERRGADIESFFVAHRLGSAYQKAGSSKKAKITSALQVTERRGSIAEVLESISQYLANAPPPNTTQKSGAVKGRRASAGVEQRIFISHASVDKLLADLLRGTLVLGGVPENVIFYSSDRATGIPTGEDVREHLRKVLGECGLVIGLISSEFPRRPIRLMEFGGAWALNKPTYPIVIPPFTRRRATNQIGEVQMGILDSDSNIDEIFDELNGRLLQNVGREVKATSWNRAVRDFKKRFPAVLPPRRASSTTQ
jgi:hypothetical protein